MVQGMPNSFRQVARHQADALHPTGNGCLMRKAGVPGICEEWSSWDVVDPLEMPKLRDFQRHHQGSDVTFPFPGKMIEFRVQDLERKLITSTWLQRYTSYKLTSPRCGSLPLASQCAEHALHWAQPWCAPIAPPNKEPPPGRESSEFQKNDMMLPAKIWIYT